MKFPPKIHTLKSGNQINIKVAEASDAQGLLDLKRNYISNTRTIPLLLEEYHNDLKKEVKLIADYSESPNSILLIAEYKSKLIGNIDLTGSQRSKMSHTGMIGMGIMEDWRNQGLGRILMESVIEWATDCSEIKVVWLDVYASNDLGVKLYKNTGFKISGIIKDFFKEGDDYIDKIQMYQHIK